MNSFSRILHKLNLLILIILFHNINFINRIIIVQVNSSGMYLFSLKFSFFVNVVHNQHDNDQRNQSENHS